MVCYQFLQFGAQKLHEMDPRPDGAISEILSPSKSRQALGVSNLMIVQFIGLYPTEIDPNVAADLSLRRLFCNFLCGSLLIVLARCEDKVEHQVLRPESRDLFELTLASFSTIPKCAR